MDLILEEESNVQIDQHTNVPMDSLADENMESCEDSEMEDCPHRKNCRLWSNLPDTALIEIYLCLQDPERVNMSMTCKNWNRVFTLPCLWRTWYVELGGYKYISTGEKICKFAESHGDHLQYLFLSYDHRRHHTSKLVQRTVDNFLHKIQNANLVRFEFQNASFLFEILKANVIDSFARFFRAQTNIVNFSMPRAHLSLTGGCRLLQAVGRASGDTIKNLDIEDFFDSRLAVFQLKQFINALYRFTNIVSLHLNYNCLSDDILECITQSLAGKLKHISCKVLYLSILVFCLSF